MAEDVLMIAERLERRTLTTGHLLIAIFETPDERAREIMSSLPDLSEITAAVVAAMPGEENN